MGKNRRVILVNTKTEWENSIREFLINHEFEPSFISYNENVLSIIEKTDPVLVVFFTGAITNDLLSLIQKIRNNKHTRLIQRFIIADKLSLEDFQRKELSYSSIWETGLHNWHQVSEHILVIQKLKRTNTSISDAPELQEVGKQYTDFSLMLIAKRDRNKQERYSAQVVSKRFIIPGIAALLVIILGIIDWVTVGEPNLWYLLPIIILLGIATGPDSLNDEWKKELKTKYYLQEHIQDYKMNEYDPNRYYTDSLLYYLFYRFSQIAAIIITTLVLIGILIWGVSSIGSMAPTTIIIILLIIIIFIQLKRKDN